MYQEIFENHHLVMLVVDPETGAIHDANPAAVDFYGWTREQLRSMSVHDINALTPENVRAEMDLARTQQRKHFYFPHRLADGSIRNVEVYSGPVDIEGRRYLFSTVLDITERSERERELAAEALRRRIMVEQSRDGIAVIREDGGLDEANLMFARMHGYSLEELAGLHAWDWNQEMTREEIQDLLSTVDHEGLRFQTVHTRKDGSTFVVEISANAAVVDGQRLVFTICHDVSQRVAAAERLSHSHDLMRYIIEHDRAAIAVHDRELRYVYVSQRYLDEYGITASDIVGRHLYDVLPDIPEKWREAHRRALAGEVIAVEDDPFELGGRTGWTSWECRPWFEKDGAVGGIIVYTEVVTERKLAERELQGYREHLEELVRERTRELEASNAQLAAATRAKSDFLTKMSHELRTPLNSVIGFSDLLLKGMAGPVTAEQQTQLTMINNGGRHLLTLVEDVLDLSRIEAGTVEVHLETFEPADLIIEVIELLAPQARVRGLDLTAAIERSPGPFTTDRGKVKQILLNLVGNALKFTESGSIRVEVPDVVEGLVCRVVDTGPGMPTEVLTRIFEPFVQYEHTGQLAKPEGTGLGLPISQQFAHMLGGEITVESSVGSGSIFTLSLP